MLIEYCDALKEQNELLLDDNEQMRKRFVTLSNELKDLEEKHRILNRINKIFCKDSFKPKNIVQPSAEIEMVEKEFRDAIADILTSKPWDSLFTDVKIDGKMLSLKMNGKTIELNWAVKDTPTE